MRKLYPFLSLLILSFNTIAQEAVVIGGLGNQEINSICNLPDGAVAATGFFDTEIKFDTSSANHYSSQGANDAFIMKLDSNNQVEWAYTLDGTANEYGNSLVSDSYGNIYVTGIFENTLRLNHAIGSSFLTSQGDFDLFIAKYTPNGGLMWLKQIGGPFKELSPFLHYGKDNHLYLSGNFEGSVDFDWGTSNDFKTNNGPQDLFLLKFDTSGNYNWVHQVSGTGYQYAGGISVNSKGEVFTAATFSDTIDLNASGPSQVLISNGGVDILCMKLDSNGQVIWGKQIGNTGVDIGIDIEHDKHDNYYLAAGFSLSVDVDFNSGNIPLQSTGSRDILLAKYSATDSLFWAHAFGGSQMDIVTQLEITNKQSVSFCGRYRDSVDFNPGSNQQYLSSVGNSDGFICTIDSLGQLENIWAIGGNSADFCNSISRTNQNFFAGGSFLDSAWYSLNGNNYKLNSIASKDAFVLNFSASQTSINKFEKKQIASIFPNPSSNDVQIRLSSDNLPTQMQLFSSSGQFLKERTIRTTRETINLPNASGTYYISLRSQGKRQLIPVIKLP